MSLALFPLSVLPVRCPGGANPPAPMTAERLGEPDAPHRWAVRVTGSFDLPGGACVTDTVELHVPFSHCADAATARAAMGLVRDLSRGATVALRGRSVFVRLREVRRVQIGWDEDTPVAALHPDAG